MNILVVLNYSLVLAIPSRKKNRASDKTHNTYIDKNNFLDTFLKFIDTGGIKGVDTYEQRDFTPSLTLPDDVEVIQTEARNGGLPSSLPSFIPGVKYGNCSEGKY